MARFVVGDERSQSTLFPERLDDYLSEGQSGPGDRCLDELDLAGLGARSRAPQRPTLTHYVHFYTFSRNHLLARAISHAGGEPRGYARFAEDSGR
jgi:hypothetical protein